LIEVDPPSTLPRGCAIRRLAAPAWGSLEYSQFTDE
jgi:hypothetical protein